MDRNQIISEIKLPHKFPDQRDRWGRAVAQLPFLGFCLMKAERGALRFSEIFFRQFVKAQGSRSKDKGQWENASLGVVMLFL
jgi:hypothetical protein